MTTDAVCEAEVTRSVQDGAKHPTPKQIDELIAKYAAAQKDLLAAQSVVSVANGIASKLKAELIEMVETYGVRHTESSKRLAGYHGKATTTTGKMLSTDPNAVESFKSYLESSHMPELVDRFFTKHVSYTLVASPDQVMGTLSFGERVRAKMTSLLALCNKVTLKSPSLKIEYVEPEKPAKKGA